MSHGPGLLLRVTQLRTHFPQLSSSLAETVNLGGNRITHLHFPAWHPTDSSVYGPERAMVILGAFLQGLGCSGTEEQCPLQSAQCHLYREDKALGSHLPRGGSRTPHTRDKVPNKKSLRATLMSKILSSSILCRGDSCASPALSKTLILFGDLHQHQKVGKRMEGENKAMTQQLNSPSIWAVDRGTTPSPKCSKPQSQGQECPVWGEAPGSPRSAAGAKDGMG